MGIDVKELKVDGGASANDFLMQFQSDMINSVVYRPQCIETTALGAAYLAGLAAGYWDNIDDIKINWQLGASFKPQMSDFDRDVRLKGWKRAVRSALDWADMT